MDAETDRADRSLLRGDSDLSDLPQQVRPNSSRTELLLQGIQVVGYAARANLRSTEGGKPRAFAGLHRVWRGVAFFKDDRAGFEKWRDSFVLSPNERAALEKVWTEQHPEPRVTLA